MTCANCSSEAIYVIGGERVSDVHYCGKCLPSWFRVDAAKGRLNITKPEPAPPKKKKASPAPAEDSELVYSAEVTADVLGEESEDAPVEE